MARKRKQDPSYRRTLTEIRSDDIQPIYLLYGEEAYLQAHVLQELEARLLDARSRAMDLHVIDADGKYAQLDFPALEDELRTPPFFSKRRMTVLKDTRLFTSAGQSAKDATEALLQVAAKQKDHCLVFVETKIDRRYRALIRAVEAAGRIVELNLQDESMLRPWIAAFLRRDGIRITEEAAESLMMRCEYSMRMLQDELQKLRLYCLGSGTEEVDMQLLDGLAPPDLQGDIFRMTDALVAGRSDEARHIYANLQQKREPLPMILFMIARHYRQLLVAADLKEPNCIKDALGTYPFVARKLAGQARHYQVPVLAGSYKLCADTDYAIKSGQMEEALAMDLLIARLASAAATR